jgi:RNA polymerase sigma factor (sigma-70 family)
MVQATSALLLRHIRQLVDRQDISQVTDSELLRRYVMARDEASFAALVRRHGPMVWSVCRRALFQYQEAEDAFQATFIVLAKKAAAVRWQSSIAGWLYTVAQRVASKARSDASRRPTTASVEPAVDDPIAALSARDLLTALDEEVAALAERYRGPLVLCWLQERTHEETARLLGISLSTLWRRLECAKRLLHARLTRRGLAPAVALGALAMAPASAVPAAALTGSFRATAATARAVALAEALLASATGKLKAALALALLACALAAGVGLTAFSPSPSPVSPEAAQKKEPPPPADVGKQPQRLDALGDPLPPSAILRLGSIRLRQPGTAFSVAYSPTADLLASGGWDRVIQFWDAATGKELRHILGPERGVWAIAFSPSGKFLAGAGFDGIVYIWSVATGKEVRRLDAHAGHVRAVAFSAKGDRLAVGADKGLSLWDIDSGKLLWAFATKDDGIYSVAFAPDGQTLAATLPESSAGIWETDSGKLVQQLPSQKERINTVVFAKDGKTLITCGSGVWDIASGKMVKRLGGPEARGGCAVFSPDGLILAVGGDDGIVRLWDWATGKEVLQIQKRPSHIRCLSFSRDGKTLACAADGGAIRLWDVATGQQKGTVAGHQERLTSVAYAPNGKTIVTAAWDGTVRLWDAMSGKEIGRVDIDPNKDASNTWSNPALMGHVALSPDGKLVAAVRGDEVVVFWDAKTLKEVFRFKGGSVAFSPDGKLIACGQRGTTDADWNSGTICLYDRITGKKQSELRGHLTTVTSMAFTPDSKTLISRGLILLGARFGEAGEEETKFVRVWDVATGKERKTFPADSRVNSVALSPDGRTVASTALDGKIVTLWETMTGGSRGELAGHTEMIFDVAWSPDGRVLASGSMDGTVRLWDPASGKEIACLAGHREWVLSVAFSPDGTKLISGSLDTTALIWDVSRFTKRQAVELTAAELESCWKDLGGDAQSAYRAIGRMISSPQSALAHLGKHVRPAPAAEAQRIAQLIVDLDSKQFKVRDLAMRQLEKLGDIAGPAVQKALGTKTTLEMKRRLELVLGKLDSANLPPETLRQFRGIETLEAIGTPQARGLLKGLVADGAPDARLTYEAKAALERMKLR